jgi:heavy metal translocating P-type ATPase
VKLVRRYPLVAGTLFVAIITLGLALSPLSWLAIWVAGAWSVAVAVRSAISMVRSLRSGTWGIDILAVTAIGATIALGDYWAALVVVLMLTSGEALEDYASRRARRELTALLSRAPRVAHRQDGDTTVEVAVEAVVVGDVLEVRPGEAVPVDGEIVGGGASFDESSLTGESLPVWRGDRDAVLSGAVNGSTVVTVRATATARDSQYQQIIDLVHAAADSKAPVVRLADRVALPFTAAAFIIAAVAWLLSGEPHRFAEVLVVATPCPLLIAAPVAFIAGMSRAAGGGVIVKSGGILEQLARVRTVAFDKTGTLTQGVPVVERVETLVGADAAAVVRVAAALEGESAHVLARAVETEAQSRGITVPVPVGVEEVVGRGVRGTVDGEPAAVGKLDFVDDLGEHNWPSLAAGEMAVYVGISGRLAGRVVLRDALRPETPATLSRMHELGVTRTVMLTGDSRDTAEAIGALAGIDDIRASLLPADKVAAVLAMKPRPVMMVGDGVNDAPVLAAADVGVAMGARGATAASESADVVVMLEDLERAAAVIEVAQRTIRIAFQSIGIGIGLSIVLMVLAAFGFIPAIVGATLQEVVDVICIFNSLRAGRK